MRTTDLPCHPVVNGIPTMLAFTGQEIGPFFVHRSAPDKFAPRRGDWTVTHARTGYAVKRHIGSKQRALALARKLCPLDCWGFETPNGVRQLPADVLQRIHALRDAA